MENKAKKDSITGNEIVDVDFFGKDLYPPKRIKMTDAGKASANLWKEIQSLWYPPRSSSKKKKTPSVRSTHSFKQPCTAKMYYTSSLKNHLEFLRNYMPQKNKDEVIDKPTLFNIVYDSVPDECIEEYAAKADARGFKIILSPESQNVDMMALARTFIKILEIETEHHFDWFGAVHTNTDHIHCHILINGVDRRTGQKIKFKKSVVKNRFREIASDICTSIVGPRSNEMIELARSRLPESRRYTKIDDAIMKSNHYMHYDAPITIDDVLYEASISTSNEILQKRLGYLCSIGLARCYSHALPPTYYLEKGWVENLKKVGRYNTYLSALQKLKYVHRQSCRMYSSDMGAIEGEVTQIYRMDDETIWNNALVVENKDKNAAWYVPVRCINDDLSIGQHIQLFAQKKQHGKVDPHITHTR